MATNPGARDLSRDLTDVANKMVREAEKTERTRCMNAVSEVLDHKQPGVVNPAVHAALEQCLCAIGEPDSEPKSCAAEPPPPDEPEMTVERALTVLKTRIGAQVKILPWHWDEIEGDLTELVKAQARRDGKIAAGMAPHPLSAGAGGEPLAVVAFAIRDKILKSAGLDA